MEVIKINSAGDNSWDRKDGFDLKARMIRPVGENLESQWWLGTENPDLVSTPQVHGLVSTLDANAGEYRTDVYIT
jgi:hypothetical protein